MTDDKAGPTRGTLNAILTDIHFWVPVVVLAIGLVLLAVLGTGAGG